MTEKDVKKNRKIIFLTRTNGGFCPEHRSISTRIFSTKDEDLGNLDDYKCRYEGCDKHAITCPVCGSKFFLDDCNATVSNKLVEVQCCECNRFFTH